MAPAHRDPSRGSLQPGDGRNRDPRPGQGPAPPPRGGPIGPSPSRPDRRLGFLRSLLLSRHWTGPFPVLVAGAMVGELALWSLLALQGSASVGVALYLLPWIVGMALALRLADHHPEARGPGPFLAAILALSLFEESLAFAVGGGLGGHASSLLDDWVRSLPGFAALGGGVLLAQRRWGADALDGFWAGAVAGVLVEVVVARGATPLAFLVFGGIAAWTYGSLAGFPLLPGGVAPAGRWRRRAYTIGIATSALLLAALVADGLANAFHV